MTCPHTTTYNGRCMDCCQRVEKRRRKVAAGWIAPNGDMMLTDVDLDWLEQQTEVEYYLQGTGRL